MAKRLLEIDALRGLAVAIMVLYHFTVDGWFLNIWEFDLSTWWLVAGGNFVRYTFLGLVGVSVVLSSRDFLAQAKRGAIIFGLGMIITLVTFFAVPGYTIWFGILHLIGLSIPFISLFKGRPLIAAALAIFIAGVGDIISGTYANTDWLLWLGIPPIGFSSLDYFPIFPWLAVPLVGIAVGHWVYEKREPTKLKILADVPGLTWMGRHALAIYLIHQPVMIVGLYLYSIF